MFDVFDHLQTGLINYPEFMYTVRGEIPENRRKIINRVWEKVKITGQPYTTYNEVKRTFSARSHPDIKNGRRF